MDSVGRAQIQQLFSKMHGGTTQRGETQRAQRQKDRWEPRSHRESQAEGEWTRAKIQVINGQKLMTRKTAPSPEAVRGEAEVSALEPLRAFYLQVLTLDFCVQNCVRGHVCYFELSS